MNFDEMIENMKNIKEDIKNKDERITEYVGGLKEIKKHLTDVNNWVEVLLEEAVTDKKISDIKDDDSEITEAPKEEETENLFG